MTKANKSFKIKKLKCESSCTEIWPFFFYNIILMLYTFFIQDFLKSLYNLLFTYCLGYTAPTFPSVFASVLRNVAF